MRCFIYGRALVETTSRLQAIYSGAVVTIAGRNYSGESEVNSIMAKSREYSILLQAWSGWRNAVGPPSKDLFRRMIEIGNMGAKAAGFHAYKWHFKVLIDEFCWENTRLSWQECNMEGRAGNWWIGNSSWRSLRRSWATLHPTVYFCSRTAGFCGQNGNYSTKETPTRSHFR